jgi:hypothetical protein
MAPVNDKIYIDQLKKVIKLADIVIGRSQYDDLSDLKEADVSLCVSRLRAAVERASLHDSPYLRQLTGIDEGRARGGNVHFAMYRGIAQSLLDDLEAGYTRGFEELIHGAVFSDFLEMAAHLVDSGYKDASAVIAGSTLEAHLRNLCRKHGIDIERSTPQGPAPKKAEALNSELSSAGAYDKLDQKNVTAWLDLRNKAAHGHYGEYTKEQVALLVSSVRDFLTRVAA